MLMLKITRYTYHTPSKILRCLFSSIPQSNANSKKHCSKNLHQPNISTPCTELTLSGILWINETHHQCDPSNGRTFPGHAGLWYSLGALADLSTWSRIYCVLFCMRIHSQPSERNFMKPPQINSAGSFFWTMTTVKSTSEEPDVIRFSIFPEVIAHF